MTDLMDNLVKPKLVFFQGKHEHNLPEFVMLHRQQHVKCLSAFFDVTVINEDCDYQQVCDKHEPDITLFESGVNYKRIYRLNIQNTCAHPQVPKLGLHNGDSWCEARAGFLSDMEEWGIETFFSICVTTAEHTPEISENLFVWPNFVDPSVYRNYEQPKIVPVLLTGRVNSLYPWRQNINKIVSQNYPSLICPHLGYENPTSKMFYGEQYARAINASWFVPTCGTVAKEVLRKHFEIPAAGSCLVTEKSASLEAAGFVDMKNCIFADEYDVLDKMSYLLQNEDKLLDIIQLGYELVHSRHTLEQRDQIFQWFNLYKNLRPEQKIVQLDPFGQLAAIEKISETRNSHIACTGLDISLLEQGDKHLWSSEYEKAEILYLKCHNYIPWMPEPKLRLALCNLYRGNAEVALEWIIQPIEYTLKEYKASAPDPIEWAYFIASLLCLGNLDEARKRASQFPSLSHPELDRARWIVNILIGEPYLNSSYTRDTIKSQFSVHKMSKSSFEDWIDQICIMLKACNQLDFYEVITAYNSGTTTSLQKRYLRKQQISVSDKTNHIDPLSIRLLSSIRQKLSLKTRAFKLLHFLEARLGYFLPYHLSHIRNDSFFQSIETLIRSEENLGSVLVIGSKNNACSKALLAGICARNDKPRVFYVNTSSQLQDSSNQCEPIDSSKENNFNISLTKASSERLVREIKRIKRGNEIHTFDAVLIDGSELADVLNLVDVVHPTKLIFLEDISTAKCCYEYQKIIKDSKYTLVAQDPCLRNGYAIFKRACQKHIRSHEMT